MNNIEKLQPNIENQSWTALWDDIYSGLLEVGTKLIISCFGK